jgi:hypothetical protein
LLERIGLRTDKARLRSNRTLLESCHVHIGFATSDEKAAKQAHCRYYVNFLRIAGKRFVPSGVPSDDTGDTVPIWRPSQAVEMGGKTACRSPPISRFCINQMQDRGELVLGVSAIGERVIARGVEVLAQVQERRPM